MGVIIWFNGGNRNSTATFGCTLEPAGGQRDVSTGCWHYSAVFVRRWDYRECLTTTYVEWLPGFGQFHLQRAHSLVGKAPFRVREICSLRRIS